VARLGSSEIIDDSDSCHHFRLVGPASPGPPSYLDAVRAGQCEI